MIWPPVFPCFRSLILFLYFPFSSSFSQSLALTVCVTLCLSLCLFVCLCLSVSLSRSLFSLYVSLSFLSLFLPIVPSSSASFFGLRKIAPHFNDNIIVISFKRRPQSSCLMRWKIAPVYWYSIIKPSQSIDRPLPFANYRDCLEFIIKKIHGLDTCCPPDHPGEVEVRF